MKPLLILLFLLIPLLLSAQPEAVGGFAGLLPEYYLDDPLAADVFSGVDWPSAVVAMMRDASWDRLRYVIEQQAVERLVEVAEDQAADIAALCAYARRLEQQVDASDRQALWLLRGAFALGLAAVWSMIAYWLRGLRMRLVAEKGERQVDRG